MTRDKLKRIFIFIRIIGMILFMVYMVWSYLTGYTFNKRDFIIFWTKGTPQYFMVGYTQTALYILIAIFLGSWLYVRYVKKEKNKYNYLLWIFVLMFFALFPINLWLIKSYWIKETLIIEFHKFLFLLMIFNIYFATKKLKKEHVH